jgi:hypothetical protein
LNNENKDVNRWRNNAKLWPDLPKSPRRMIVDSPFFTLVEERAYIRGDHRDASFESRGRRLGQATDSERTTWLARSAGMEVVRGDVTAIPFVMATERIAEFEGLVGRWDEARHRAALADGRHAYFVARDGSEPIGFVILRDWASPERVTLVKRIAVSRPGCGYGRALLAKVIDAVFEETVTWRLWLGVYPTISERVAPTKPLASRRKESRAAPHSLGASPEMNWSWRYCARNGQQVDKCKAWGFVYRDRSAQRPR